MGWQNKNLGIGFERRQVADRMVCRASSTSVVIARSSDSRMARPNPSSCSARTPVALHGLSFSEDNTRRVFPRYGIFNSLVLRDGLGNKRDEVRM